MEEDKTPTFSEPRIQYNSQFLLKPISGAPNCRFASQRSYGYALSQKQQFGTATKWVSPLKGEL